MYFLYSAFSKSPNCIWDIIIFDGLQLCNAFSRNHKSILITHYFSEFITKIIINAWAFMDIYYDCERFNRED